MTKKQRDRARFSRREVRLVNDGKVRIPKQNTFDVRQHATQHTTLVDTNLEPVVLPGGHVFERVFRWTEPTVQAAGTTGTTLTGYDGVAHSCKLRVGAAPTSGANFDLLLSGVSVNSISLSAGQSSTDIIDLNNIPFSNTDTWAVKQTNPVDVGATIRVWIYVAVNLQ